MFFRGGGEALLTILGYSLIAGLATSLGAIVVLFWGRPERRGMALFLGMAAGVMLAVVGLDLLPSALAWGGGRDIILGFSLGGCLLWGMDRLLSFSFQRSLHPNLLYRHLGFLIALGISIHDLPEGMAIALGYTAAQQLGPLIVLAIGIHNIPEGMAIAAPLSMSGLETFKIILITLLVSIITPIGTALGMVMTYIAPGYFALLLALAAGCMLYLVFFELIPEARMHHRPLAVWGLILGFSVIVLTNLAM